MRQATILPSGYKKAGGGERGVNHMRGADVCSVKHCDLVNKQRVQHACNSVSCFDTLNSTLNIV